MIIKYLRNLTRDIVFETIGWSYHFYIYLKQDRKYFSDLSKGISHSEIIHQTQPATDKICIFVLFQRDEVPKHVLVQLDWINKLGYSIHIVSNTTIKQQSVETLKQYSFKITERPNIGYDFGAYQYGVKDFLSNYVDKATRLMLMNDSIFFPLLDPRELYEKVDQRDNDFWGWTENWQIHYHVASYGIVFKRSAFVSEAFYNFWAQYKPYSNRRHAINNGEVKLTEKLVNANLQPDTAIKSQAINHSLRNKHKADIIGFLGLLSDMSLSALGLNKKEINKIEKHYAIELITLAVDKHNVAHDTFLPINILLNFPILKKDIIYKDILSSGKLLSNIKIDESVGIDKEEIDAFFRLRGRLKDQRGKLFKRILAARAYH